MVKCYHVVGEGEFDYDILATFPRKKDANSFMRYCNQRKREDDEHYDYEYFHIISSPFYEVW